MITNPWPWYIGGPLIALVMFSLLYMGKNFGFSANLRTLCSACGAGKTSSFFQFNWRAQKWNLMVLIGAIIGGFVAKQYLAKQQVPQLNPKTVAQLHAYGFKSAGSSYNPTELMATQHMASPMVVAVLLVGGILVGFGARYAGGCTSGHSISGISNLQLPSLIATIGFFIGGLVMVHLIYPFIF